MKEDELAVLCPSRQAPSFGTRYESEKELTFEPPVSNNDFYHHLKVSTTLPYSVNRSSTAKAIIFATGTLSIRAQLRISIRLKLAPASQLMRLTPAYILQTPI